MNPIRILLACLLCLRTAVSFAAPESSPFAGDARMQEKLTIHAAGLPMREILADITARTGIKLSASSKVAEDKAVLFVRDRPLASTLAHLAKFFNFMWEREGQQGDYSYILTQSLTQERAERDLVGGKAARAADEVVREIRLCQAYLALPPEGRPKQPDLIARAMAETDYMKRSELDIQAAIAAEAQSPGGITLGTRLLSSLDRDAILRLMSQGRKDYRHPSRDGQVEMPEQMRTEIENAARHQSVEFTTADPSQRSLALQIVGVTGLDPRISGSALVHMQDGRIVSNIGFTFPMNSAYELAQMDPAVEPPDWKDRKELAESVSLQLYTHGYSRPTERQPLKQPWIAEALNTLDVAHPIELISDCFYPKQTSELSRILDLRDRPLGEAVGLIAGGSGRSWSYADGVILLKSRTYAADRFSEPPISRLRAWTTGPIDRLFSLDTMAEMADQPQLRFDRTVAFLVALGAAQNAYDMNPRRSQLVLWNRLSAASRKAALSPQGLAYVSLLPGDRESFERASRDMLSDDSNESKAQEKRWNPGALLAARLYVQAGTEQLWGFRQGAYSYTSRSHEQARNTIQRRKPGAPAVELEEGKRLHYDFEFKAGDESFSTFLVTSPVIWLSTGKALSASGG